MLAAGLLIGVACDTDDVECEGGECDAKESPGGKADDIDSGGEAPRPALDLADGTWSEPRRAPVHFLHGALLHTGRVVMFSGLYNGEQNQTYAIWDSVTGETTTTPLPDNLLCSHHSQLPNGDLLLMGGGGSSAGSQRSWSLVLDAETEAMEHIAPMNTTRWYPTVIPLADGRQLVASGHWTGSRIEDTLEIFDPATQGWSEVEGSRRVWSAFYPSLKLLPNGDVLSPFALGFFQSGQQAEGTRVLRFDGADSARWVTTPNLEFHNRQEGTTAILVDDSGDTPESAVMVIGGGTEDNGSVLAGANTKSVEILHTGDGTGTAQWRRAADLEFGRTNVSAVVLPTGDVMAIGGRRSAKFSANHDPVPNAEIYDVEEDRWETTEDFSSVRLQYHNVALLLPDGRVFAGGGNNPSLGSGTDLNQREFELFRPAYMDVDRPEFVSVPEDVGYGESFTVAVDDPNVIDTISMISLGSVTHHTDAGNRYVRLGFERASDGTLSVRAPRDGNIMPPGWVMLFVVDGDVPSVAAMVRVGEPTDDGGGEGGEEGGGEGGGEGSEAQWEGLEESGSVAQDEEHRLATPTLPPGRYVFDLSGTNDADLYVRANMPPTVDDFDCRPFIAGSDETCTLELAEEGVVHLMVRGWDAESDYTLVGGAVD